MIKKMVAVVVLGILVVSPVFLGIGQNLFGQEKNKEVTKKQSTVEISTGNVNSEEIPRIPGIKSEAVKWSREGHKTSTELLQQAYQNKRIDKDKLVLYTIYGVLRLKEKIPLEFQSEVFSFDKWLFMTKAVQVVEENWNKLRPETREKIKLAYWENFLKENPGSAEINVAVTSPQDNLIVATPEVVIEGIISMVEIYDLNSAWIELNGSKVMDIKLDKMKYESPLVDKNSYKDKQGLAEVFSPPGRKVYEFKERVKIPWWYKNDIAIGVKCKSLYEDIKTSNMYLEGHTVGWPVHIFYYDKTDTISPVIGEVRARLRYIDIKDIENRIQLELNVTANDDKAMLSLKAELNDKPGASSNGPNVTAIPGKDTTLTIDYRGTVYQEPTEEEIQRLPQGIIDRKKRIKDRIVQGGNILKIIAQDIGGNITEKTMEINLEKYSQ